MGPGLSMSVARCPSACAVLGVRMTITGGKRKTWVRDLMSGVRFYSHSIVPGGFEVMS